MLCTLVFNVSKPSCVSAQYILVTAWLCVIKCVPYRWQVWSFCIFFGHSFKKPHLCARQCLADLMFFSIPAEHGSRCKQPRDVRAPSTLQHKKAEALGRFEATVEASGTVWDRSAAWILCTDLHDKGGIGSSHPNHHWKCTHGEYCSVRGRDFTILPPGDWTNHLSITCIWGQSYFFTTIGVSWLGLALIFERCGSGTYLLQ